MATIRGRGRDRHRQLRLGRRLPRGARGRCRPAVDEYGKLDIVVGCAGAIIDGTLAADDDTYLRFMSLFLHQKFWLARAALPGMAERGWGRLVTTTSHGAHRPARPTDLRRRDGRGDLA